MEVLAENDFLSRKLLSRIKQAKKSSSLNARVMNEMKQQMVMVVHQAVSVADPIVALVDMLECVEKVYAVLVGLEDLLFFISPGGDVIHPVRKNFRICESMKTIWSTPVSYNYSRSRKCFF
jgi:hypothetical protein